MEENKPSPSSTENDTTTSPDEEVVEEELRSEDVEIAPATQALLDRHAEILKITADVRDRMEVAIAQVMMMYPGERGIIMKVLAGEQAKLLAERDQLKKGKKNG